MTRAWPPSIEASKRTARLAGLVCKVREGRAVSVVSFCYFLASGTELAAGSNPGGPHLPRLKLSHLYSSGDGHIGSGLTWRSAG